MSPFCSSIPPSGKPTGASSKSKTGRQQLGNEIRVKVGGRKVEKRPNRVHFSVAHFLVASGSRACPSSSSSLPYSVFYPSAPMIDYSKGAEESFSLFFQKPDFYRVSAPENAINNTSSGLEPNHPTWRCLAASTPRISTFYVSPHHDL